MDVNGIVLLNKSPEYTLLGSIKVTVLYTSNSTIICLKTTKYYITIIYDITIKGTLDNIYSNSITYYTTATVL